MVFVREKPIYKWMMTGCTPNLRNPHIFVDIFIYMYVCICIYNCIQWHMIEDDGWDTKYC